MAHGEWKDLVRSAHCRVVTLWIGPICPNWRNQLQIILGYGPARCGPEIHLPEIAMGYLRYKEAYPVAHTYE